MQNNRKKVYDFPHKAIRYAISKLVQEAGQTNYRDPKENQDLFQLGTEIFNILEIHARDEESVSLKYLEIKNQDASSTDKEEHKYLEAKIDELRSLLERIHSEVSQAGAISDIFYEKLIRFQTDYFSHMTREEEETQSFLHLYFTDTELDSHQQEIFSKFEKEELKLWAKYLLPNVPTPVKDRFEEMLK
ncbi:hemerythrin domain-containing protein [Leptospira sarikeiensis]|uniref:Cation-binding protein n=1 Tax=Leptospira sarikeiensis TaxID=2484943 RepID=A0A4V3JS73_9LEPT|nr:hemerythrin domain-containing protein [Leptospira sarikeiensis]TGL63550.1 cation-binding protein [Leptospira sarikeiensis]